MGHGEKVAGADAKVGFLAWSMNPIEMNEQLAQAYEQLGLDHAWVIDHLLGLSHPDRWGDLPASAALADPDAFLDPFCVATAVGRAAPGIQVGSGVVDLTRRRAIDYARSVLTVQHSCTKPFLFGVGAGLRLNLEPFGYQMEGRVGQFEQNMKELRSLLDTGRMPDGVGRIGLPLESAGGRPQIWAAAHGPRMQRIAGRLADGWISSGITAEQYATDRERVFAAAEKANRPEPTCAFSPFVFIGASRDAVAATLEEVPTAKLLMLFAPAAVWEKYGLEHPTGPEALGYNDALPHSLDPELLREIAPRIPFEMFEELVFTGTGEDIAERLRPYAAAGAEHFIIGDVTGLAVAPEQAAAAMPEYARVRAALRGELSVPVAS